MDIVAEFVRHFAQRSVIEPYLSKMVRLFVVDFDESGRKAQVLPAIAAKRSGMLPIYLLGTSTTYCL